MIQGKVFSACAGGPRSVTHAGTNEVPKPAVKALVALKALEGVAISQTTRLAASAELPNAAMRA